MDKVEKKRENEKKIVIEMIHLYCHDLHNSTNNCCELCQGLIDYSVKRIMSCPFMEEKSFCSNCKVHCYKPEMRDYIKKVMKYSGPRMLFRHPLLTIRHLVSRVVK